MLINKENKNNKNIPVLIVNQPKMKLSCIKPYLSNIDYWVIRLLNYLFLLIINQLRMIWSNIRSYSLNVDKWIIVSINTWALRH
jgi:hypothetical protein